MVFGECGLVIYTMGTMYLYINDNYQYWVWVDRTYRGLTDWYGDCIFYNIPIGHHAIYLKNTDYWCKDSNLNTQFFTFSVLSLYFPYF